MSTVTLKELNEKRKSKPYKLTKEQEQHLLKQKNVSIEKCRDADEVYKELKKSMTYKLYYLLYMYQTLFFTPIKTMKNTL